MPRAALWMSLLVALPALAGCFSSDASQVESAAVAASAAEAGAVAGPAPVAAKSAYRLDERETVYPLSIHTTPAKAPYVQEFRGEYTPQQCTAGGELPLGGLGFAEATQVHDVTEAFAKHDVFAYDVSLTWTNTDSSWAELHLWYQFDGAGDYWSQPTSDGRGLVTLNFSGQGLIVQDEFFAAVGVDCWYGSVTTPIAYTITLSVTFAEGAIPAEVPILMRVPAEATRLYVSGVPLDSTQGVNSHFRVFRPDDTLLCECALNTNEAAAPLDLPEPGDYVVLVDHTANGFVALGLDAPSAAPLEPLATSFVEYPLFTTNGESVDQTLTVDFPSTPLTVWAWVFAPGSVDGPPDVGAGHAYRITVSNARGDVLRQSMVGYVTFHAALPGLFFTNDWYAVPLDGEWEFYVDHHAYDTGGHTVHVAAEQMRGRASLFVQHYERPA